MTRARGGPDHAAMQAEVIATGGRIFRGLAGGLAEALALARGRVLAVGRRAEIEELAGPGTRRLDLAGRVAIPAFHEAHMHLLPLGLVLSQVSLRAPAVRRLEDILDRLREAAARSAPGEWVLGAGYDHAALAEARHPTAAELDLAVPDRPAFIMRACGHMGVANSMALRAAGIGPQTPDPPGGVIDRLGGSPTGLLQERALHLIQRAMPAPSRARLIEAIAAAGRHLAEQGFASASDMNVGMTAGLAEIAAYREAAESGCLLQRMWLVLAGNPEGIAADAVAAGLRPWRRGDDPAALLRCGAVKVFADGSAGGLTAAFFDPYLAADTRGVLTFPAEEMHALLARYHAEGWQLAIHAIGDAAIEQVLSGMEALGTTPDRRHRIEHCGFATPDQRRRMRARGILPVPQPVFMYEFGDLYLRNLGRERAERAYPMRSWLREGQHPSASSDAPVCPTDPFLNLFAMVTRQTSQGSLLGPEERLTLPEALHCATWCGAYASFVEDRRGALEPGMDADIAVLSQDIFASSVEALPSTRCDITLRGGVVIYDRHRELS
ncbi:MAG: amidohydrolase [Rhodovarius sp.]|nr:amidohydrolase [Rhodovarius sp.]